MSVVTVYFTFPLYVLAHLLAAEGYTYQTKPLSLSYADLAALEAISQFEDPGRTAPAPAPAPEDRERVVEVKCLEDSIEVVVRARFLHGGFPLEASRLRLGPDSGAQERCAAELSTGGDYVIRAPLAACGNRVMFTKTGVLFSNLLLFSLPPSSPADSSHLDRAAVPLLCEYERRYTVSSGALKPTWTPVVYVESTHLRLDFHLRLMTNDWSSERNSPVYLMGEMVHIEASVDHHHPTLRLYAGSCVATLTPDVNSYPRYPFIDHQGCFTDSQLSGSSSRFLRRVQDKLLQIQLEPFLFHDDHRHTVYITCHLEAAPFSESDPEKRACSFISGRWRSADGDDHVCESCHTAEETAGGSSAESGHKREQRSRRERGQKELKGEATLGPIIFLPEQDNDSENLVYL
ncbi:zona pellucida sperm-binding protein 3-like [Xenentodon cancila]